MSDVQNNDAISQVTFHGSLSGSIKTFRPLAHFGSLAQAAQAALRHKEVFQEPGEPTVFEVQLTYFDHELITMEDWGDPQPMRMAYEFMRFENGKWKEIFQFAFNQYTQIVNSPERPVGSPYTLDPSPLLIALAKIKKRLIRYKNNVEGNGSELAFCVIDPKIIQIIQTREFTTQEQQTASEENRVRDRKNGFLV
jgi:hypothetical protein